jgi:hypothetical protein
MVSLKIKKNNIENDNAGEKKKTNIDAKKTDKKNKLRMVAGFTTTDAISAYRH